MFPSSWFHELREVALYLCLLYFKLRPGLFLRTAVWNVTCFFKSEATCSKSHHGNVHLYETNRHLVTQIRHKCFLTFFMEKFSTPFPMTWYSLLTQKDKQSWTRPIFHTEMNLSADLGVCSWAGSQTKCIGNAWLYPLDPQEKGSVEYSNICHRSWRMPSVALVTLGRMSWRNNHIWVNSSATKDITSNIIGF